MVTEQKIGVDSLKHQYVSFKWPFVLLGSIVPSQIKILRTMISSIGEQILKYNGEFILITFLCVCNNVHCTPSPLFTQLFRTLKLARLITLPGEFSTCYFFMLQFCFYTQSVISESTIKLHFTSHNLSPQKKPQMSASVQ